MEIDEKEKRLTQSAELEAPTKEQSSDEGKDAQEDDTTEKNAGKVISGYAIKFGEPSKDLGGFVEIITKEAMQEVDLSDVCLLIGHDFSQILARTKNDTLKLEVKEEGLYFEATLPNTSYANDIYENIQAGNVDSMSFGFTIPEDGDVFTKTEEGIVTRTVNKIKSLFDISVVTIPAYDSANVQVDKRSFDLWKQTTKKGENKNMEKVILQNEGKTELRSFEEYIRSQGEVRDGLTTVNASVVVPQEVIGEVFNLKRNFNTLSQYVTVKNVSTGKGKYPVATNQTATLVTKAELAEITDIDADMFTQVEYNVETRAGKIALSNEVVEDAVVPIVSEVKEQLNKLVDNTDNKHIIDKLKTFTKVEATTLDDIKKVNNVDLDPALNKSVVLNQSAYNYLDTLKDSDGRYILQPDVTAPSGLSLFGLPILPIRSDKELPNGDGGELPIIIGDLQQAIFLARRNQVTTQWEKFDYYSQGLAVIVRNDYQVIDEDAVRYIELTPTPAV